MRRGDVVLVTFISLLGGTVGGMLVYVGSEPAPPRIECPHYCKNADGSYSWRQVPAIAAVPGTATTLPKAATSAVIFGGTATDMTASKTITLSKVVIGPTGPPNNWHWHRDGEGYITLMPNEKKIRQ